MKTLTIRNKTYFTHDGHLYFECAGKFDEVPVDSLGTVYHQKILKDLTTSNS